MAKLHKAPGGKDIKMHYAVWKAKQPYMWPACWSTSLTLISVPQETPLVVHGLAIYRGDVTCNDCLTMMGIV